jgi:hypothetical protein
VDAADDIVLSPHEILEVGLEYDFPGTIDYLVEKSASAAKGLRHAVSDCFTSTSVGVYWHPTEKKAALYIDSPDQEADFKLCLKAISEKVGSDNVSSSPLAVEDLASDWWVKVAYSPTIRNVGEALQFFPSKKIPGFGGRPIASTIASALLGAGLGYGGGYLLDKFTPKSLRDERGRLKYWGAGLGAALGGLGGAVPGFTNMMTGKKFNDPHIFSRQATEDFEADLGEKTSYERAIQSYLAKQAEASEKAASAYGTIGGPSYEELPNVRTNRLGQVLWDTYAGPQTTAMAMGAMHGANQMPDPRSRPGIVTPHQTGLFGMAMGAAGGGVKGYATGWAVGKALGILTGMPQGTQDKLKQTGAVLGVINSVVPRLFN